MSTERTSSKCLVGRLSGYVGTTPQILVNRVNRDNLTKLCMQERVLFSNTFIDTDCNMLVQIMGDFGYDVTIYEAMKVWSHISTKFHNTHWSVVRQYSGADVYEKMKPYFSTPEEIAENKELHDSLQDMLVAVTTPPEKISTTDLDQVLDMRRKLYDGALREAAKPIGVVDDEFARIIAKDTFGYYTNSVIGKFFITLSDFMDVLRGEFPNSTERDNFLRYVGKDGYINALRSYIIRAVKEK